MSLSRRLARPLLAAVFISEGVDTLRHPEPRVAMADPVAPQMVQKLGLRTDTQTLVKINAGVHVGAGALLALGKFRRLAALALIGSIIPTTYAGHRFWESDDPATRKQQQIHFLKNLGLLGGLILAAVDTEGAPSVGWRARRSARRAGDALSLGGNKASGRAGAKAAKAAAGVSAASSRAGRKAAAKANKGAAKTTAKANKGAAAANAAALKLASKANTKANRKQAKTANQAARQAADQANRAAYKAAAKATKTASKTAAKAGKRAGDAVSTGKDALSTGSDWAGDAWSTGSDRASELISVGAQRANDVLASAADRAS